MLDRWQTPLKYATYVLAALLFFELVLGILHCLPFVGVTIPTVPTLDTPVVTTFPQPAKIPPLPTLTAPTKTVVPTAPTNPPLPVKPVVTGWLPKLWTRCTAFFQKAFHLSKTEPLLPSPTGMSMSSKSSSPTPTTVAKPPPAVMTHLAPPTPEKQLLEAITKSEILGPVVHPLPSALLGIAGDQAIIRSDSGETALVKEGGTVGDIHLLRIGINRVLIEQNGQKQELLMFDGYGGESLLPKEPESSNENK